MRAGTSHDGYTIVRIRPDRDELSGCAWLYAPVPAFSRAHLVPLQELAARILETRAIEGDPSQLARELMVGFHELCLRLGLDGVLAELELTDDADATEHPEIREALAARIGDKAQFDPRGPRNAKPKQLADAVISALGLEVADAEDRTITLDDDARRGFASALLQVLEVELATPKIREDIIRRGRQACEERYLSAYDKITAQLDERGMRMVRQPKVALDAVQVIQQLLFDARFAAIEHGAQLAIDRAKPVLANSSQEAADRLEQPISLKLTPRQVAIRRVADARTSKVPQAVAQGLFDALTELMHLAWRSQERPVREYAASATFAVGELVEHPKFGRGSVLTVAIQRIEVEFPDGKFTLVHGRK